MANDIKHYGVLGMRWGKRKASGDVTSVKVGRGPAGRLKELAGLAVDGVRDDANRVRKAGASVKEWGGEYKQAIKNNAKNSKLMDEAIKESMAETRSKEGIGGVLRRGILYSKTSEIRDLNQRFNEKMKTAEVKKVDSFLSKIGAGLKDGFHKWQIKSQDRDIKLFKEIVDGYNKAKNPLSERDKKLKSEFENQIKALEDDLNNLYSADELKKYRG